MKIDYYAKAALAFVVPGVTALGIAITAGSAGGEAITQTEWIGALFACILTAGAVYGVPNKTVEPDESAEDDNSPGDEAHIAALMGQADPPAPKTEPTFAEDQGSV